MVRPLAGFHMWRPKKGNDQQGIKPKVGCGSKVLTNNIEGPACFCLFSIYQGGWGH